MSSADAGRLEAREVTRRHARSFHVASHLLPRARRDAACVLYAFCRAADDAVDTGDPAEAGARLETVRARLDRVYAQRPADALESALAEEVARWSIDRAAFDGLLEGMALDLGHAPLRTTQELLRYCHLVAGVVGHLMLPVLGATRAAARDRAAELGVAMQLTNILRDVDEDLARGRIYLAAEELAQFGLTHGDVRARIRDERWLAFVRAQIARARRLYAQALQGVPLIETWSGRLCTRAMALIYGDILRALELRGGDPFAGRARVGPARKLWLLARALVGADGLYERPALPLAGLAPGIHGGT